jgi:plastocyanin
MTSEFTALRLNDCLTPWNSHFLGHFGAKYLVGSKSSLLAIFFFAMSILIAGCGTANTHTTPSQIAITPGTVTLSPSQSQQFAVTGTGASVRSLQWEINGIQGGNAGVGTISSGGLYVAPSGAEVPVSVTISATDPTASGTNAQATVRFRHDSITLSPNEVTVASGRTVQFAASSSNQGEALEWKVNGVVGGNSTLGTISAGGIYSAPACSPSATSFTIEVTSSTDASASAQAQLNIKSEFTLSPAQASVPLGQTVQFELMSSGPDAPVVQWSVNGTVGGNSQVGSLSGDGTFTAPGSIPGQPILIAVTDVTQGCPIAQAQIQVYDPAVNEVHDKWLDGVADAAASYGCTDVAIQQEANETVESALARYQGTAAQGSCLVLRPISNETGLFRYSLAWGGTTSGKDIFYISDVDRVRIWNALAVN